jgi:sugar phosphate isomerase/epimerase
MHKLSLHHLTMLAAHPLELVDAAAAGGFDYCGLRLISPTSTDADSLIDVVGNPPLQRDIAARLDETGVRLLDIEAIWLQASTRVSELEAAIAAGSRLGASRVLAVGFDADKGRQLDNFCRLCELAARHGMDVSLEFISYCKVSNLNEALQLIERSGQGNARLLIDALQFFRSGALPADLGDVDPALMPYMQICDAPLEGPVTLEERRREARTARQLPGEGELPLHELLQAMPPDIVLSVEAPTLHLAGLPFAEQARIAGAATRRFLAPLT